MKMCEGVGLPKVINNSLSVRGSKGYEDSDHILSMVTMQICGGSTVDDLNLLKQNVAVKGSPFKIPSPTAARSFLSNFHDAEEAGKQKKGQCYIPLMNEHLAGFNAVHAYVFQQAYKFKPLSSITLDQDATFIPTSTKGALFNKKKNRPTKHSARIALNMTWLLERSFEAETSLPAMTN
jgi:hypothetical protein